MKANSRERQNTLKGWAFPGCAASWCLYAVNTSLFQIFLVLITGGGETSNGGAALAEYTPINPSLGEIPAKAANFGYLSHEFYGDCKGPCPHTPRRKPQTTW